MISALLLLIANSSVTPQRLIDQSFDLRGYGAITESALPTPSLTVPVEEGEDGVAIRIRNRWRVRPHKKVPGLYIAEVGTREDVFGTPPPSKNRLSAVKESVSEEAPPDLEELKAPGGVRILVRDLLAHYKISGEVLPWMYRARTIRLRLDRARVSDPLPLIVALVGAKDEKKAQRSPNNGQSAVERADVRPTEQKSQIVFDPATFRPLAAATLKNVSNRESEPDLQSEAFLGSYAFEQISDSQLRTLYRVPNALEAVRCPLFRQLYPNYAQSRLERKFGADSQHPEYQKFLSLIDPEGQIAIGLSNDGKGRLAFQNSAHDGWVLL